MIRIIIRNFLLLVVSRRGRTEAERAAKVAGKEFASGEIPLLQARVDGARMRGVASIAIVVALGAAAYGAVVWRGAAIASRGKVPASARVHDRLAEVMHEAPPVFGGDLTVRCQLPVRNWWDEPIRFVRVVPTCSCSVAELAEDVLPPGGETVLSVEVRFPPVGGRRAISCTLESETGHTAVHGFEAVAYPDVQLDAENEVIRVGSLRPGEIRTVSARFLLHAPPGDPPPVIRAVRCENEQVEATIAEVGEAVPLADGSGSRAEATLDLRVAASNRPGRFVRDITIEYDLPARRGTETNSGEPQLAHALATWEVQSLIDFDPPRVFLAWPPGSGANAGNSPEVLESTTVERTITVSSTDGRPFGIVSARSDVPWVETGSLPDVPSPRHVLAVILKPELVERSGFASLEVILDHPHQSAIWIPVAISRRDGRVEDGAASVETALAAEEEEEIEE